MMGLCPRQRKPHGYFQRQTHLLQVVPLRDPDFMAFSPVSFTSYQSLAPHSLWNSGKLEGLAHGNRQYQKKNQRNRTWGLTQAPVAHLRGSKEDGGLLSCLTSSHPLDWVCARERFKVICFSFKMSHPFI